MSCDFVMRDAMKRSKRNAHLDANFTPPPLRQLHPMTSDAQAPVKLSLPLVYITQNFVLPSTNDITGIPARYLQRAA